MNDAPFTAKNPASALALLVGREFVEALDEGLRRVAAGGFKDAAAASATAQSLTRAQAPARVRTRATPAAPSATQAKPDPARGTAASVDLAWRQLAVSVRQLESTVADLPSGHPAGDQAIRALTQAIRAIRTRPGVGR